MRQKDLRILVVENHSDTRQGIQLFLKALGYHASLASGMESALALAARESFDVLLSDISLPDGDGWRLLTTLATRGQRPPHAFAMSGLGAPEDFARSRAAGFEHHLLKPFPPEDLEKALAELMDETLSLIVDPAAKVALEFSIPGRVRQKMHDGLCQQLAAAALLQAALVNRLESCSQPLPVNGLSEEHAMSPPIPSPMPEITAEARYIGQILHEALRETQTLLHALKDCPASV